jgi:hypothetical protein
MRTLEVKCDNCGKTRPVHHRPKTWYLVEDQSEVMRTGPIDLCSLRCLTAWSQDPQVCLLLPDLPEPEGVGGV